MKCYTVIREHHTRPAVSIYFVTTGLRVIYIGYTGLSKNDVHDRTIIILVFISYNNNNNIHEYTDGVTAVMLGEWDEIAIHIYLI